MGMHMLLHLTVTPTAIATVNKTSSVLLLRQILDKELETLDDEIVKQINTLGAHMEHMNIHMKIRTSRTSETRRVVSKENLRNSFRIWTKTRKKMKPK